MPAVIEPSPITEITLRLRPLIRSCGLGTTAADLPLGTEPDPLRAANPVVVSPCGTWSVEFAECLASCGTAPVLMVNDDFHEAIDPDKAEALLDNYRKQSS